MPFETGKLLEIIAKFKQQDISWISDIKSLSPDEGLYEKESFEEGDALSSVRDLFKDSDEGSNEEKLFVGEQEVISFVKAIKKQALFQGEEDNDQASDNSANISNTIPDNIVVLKQKLGFASVAKDWIKAPQEGNSLNKENAKKFFFQRLLLDLYQDQDQNQETNTDDNQDSQNDVFTNDVKKLYLEAKFNQKIEEEGKPEGYRFSLFFGYVKEALENKEDAGVVDDKVILRTIERELLGNKESGNNESIDEVHVNTPYLNGWIKKQQQEEEEAAAVKIQAFLRGRKAKKEFDSQKDSAIKIQKWFREINSKQKEREINSKQKENLSNEESPNTGSSTTNTSVTTEESSKLIDEFKKLLSDQSRSTLVAQSEWQDDKRSISFQDLREGNYLNNGENHFLIPEITGRDPNPVTQYKWGFPVFNYNSLNEFSQDADKAAQEEWGKDDRRLLSSIACIKDKDGKNERYCVATSSARGVTKSFISQAEFNKIVNEAHDFYEDALEAAIKNSALDTTLEVLNSAKSRLKANGEDIAAIEDRIGAIEVLRTHMTNLTTKYDDYSLDERLNLFNKLDIELPTDITDNFNDEEKEKFKNAKSRTVVDDDNNYKKSLEVALKINAAFEINDELDKAIARHKDQLKVLEEEKQKNSDSAAGDMTDGELVNKINAANSAIEALKEFIENQFNNGRPKKNATFSDKEEWSLTKALEGLDELQKNNYLNAEETDKIINFASKAIDKSKDTQKDIADKLTSADVNRINDAQKLCNNEFGIKTNKQKEKLKNATDEEKEIARHVASCRLSRTIAKRVEKSIQKEGVHGLHDSEIKRIAEDMEKAQPQGYFYNDEKPGVCKKNVSQLLKSPSPHTPLNGVSFLRPRGKNIVSVAFNYSEAGIDNPLTGGNEAYAYITGTNQCYVRCQVCKQDGPMTVYRNGVAVSEDHKRGDVVIDQNTISFLDTKTGKYTPVNASNDALKKHLEKNGENHYGIADTIIKQFKSLQIKAISQVDNAAPGQEPDIECKVAVMYKGQSLSHNGDVPERTITKKREAKEFMQVDGENNTEKATGFEFDENNKPKNDQTLYAKMNDILSPEGKVIVTPYVKLEAKKGGEVIQDPQLFFISEENKMSTLQETNIKESLSDELKGEASKIFEDASKSIGENTRLFFLDGKEVVKRQKDKKTFTTTLPKTESNEKDKKPSTIVAVTSCTKFAVNTIFHAFRQ